MDNDFKKIIHAEINEPLNKIADISIPKIKKANYKLMVFWTIVGVLSIILLYYAYEMLYLYF